MAESKGVLTINYGEATDDTTEVSRLVKAGFLAVQESEAGNLTGKRQFRKDLSTCAVFWNELYPREDAVGGA